MGRPRSGDQEDKDMGAIGERGRGQLEVVGSGARLGELGLTIEAGMGYEEWAALGRGVVAKVGRGQMWWLGDYLNAGERMYGEEHAQVLDELGYDHVAMSIARWVAGGYSVGERVVGLSFGHHRVAMGVKDRVRRAALLATALSRGLSVGELRQRVAEERRGLGTLGGGLGGEKETDRAIALLERSLEEWQRWGLKTVRGGQEMHQRIHEGAGVTREAVKELSGAARAAGRALGQLLRGLARVDEVWQVQEQHGRPARV